MIKTQLKIQIEDFEDLRDRLFILQKRKNEHPLGVFKKVRLRTGYFKIYESCERLELLELEN